MRQLKIWILIKILNIFGFWHFRCADGTAGLGLLKCGCLSASHVNSVSQPSWCEIWGLLQKTVGKKRWIEEWLLGFSSSKAPDNSAFWFAVTSSMVWARTWEGVLLLLRIKIQGRGVSPFAHYDILFCSLSWDTLKKQTTPKWDSAQSCPYERDQKEVCANSLWETEGCPDLLVQPVDQQFTALWDECNLVRNQCHRILRSPMHVFETC